MCFMDKILLKFATRPKLGNPTSYNKRGTILELPSTSILSELFLPGVEHTHHEDAQGYDALPVKDDAAATSEGTHVDVCAVEHALKRRVAFLVCVNRKHTIL